LLELKLMIELLNSLMLWEKEKFIYFLNIIRFKVLFWVKRFIYYGLTIKFFCNYKFIKNGVLIIEKKIRIHLKIKFKEQNKLR